jgi:hypothetical protein
MEHLSILLKETGPELVTLDTIEIMDFEVVKGLKEVPSIGKYMFSEFVRDRREKSIQTFI